ncbi:MAG: hypothetical protein H7Z16_19255 [Pyrinomonadaceae bacterium]|nr:hypothetical protein [Pyrinomonadaceae bacterium]
MLPTLRAQFNYWGHDCVMMIVSAAGDSSNVDNFTAAEFIEDWRLVPNDNNIGQRNVTFAPGRNRRLGLARPQLTSLPSTMKENPYAHQSCRDETPPS